MSPRDPGVENNLADLVISKARNQPAILRSRSDNPGQQIKSVTRHGFPDQPSAGAIRNGSQRAQRNGSQESATTVGLHLTFLIDLHPIAPDALGRDHPSMHQPLVT